MKLFTAIMMCLFGLTANAEKISLEDRVSELEASQSLNVFSFSGSLNTYVNLYSYEQPTAISQADAYGPYVTNAAAAAATSAVTAAGESAYNIALISQLASGASAAAAAGVAAATRTSVTSSAANIAAANTAATAALNKIYGNIADQSVKQKTNAKILRERFQLNVDANVSPSTKFYSRFTMSKQFTGLVKQGVSTNIGLTDDLGQSNTYTDSKLYCEKAYGDIQLPDGATVFSIGRLPTVDGPPVHLYNGKARMGTYPMLAYNSNLDGAALTYRFDKYFAADSGHHFSLRLIDTPFTMVSSDLKTPPVEGPNSDWMPTVKDGNAVQLDYNNDKLSWASNMNVIAQVIDGGPIHFNPGVDSRATTNTTVNPTDLSMHMNMRTFFLELNNVANTNLDISLTNYTSTIKTLGTIYTYIPASTGIGSAPTQNYLPVGGFGCSIDAAGKGCDSTLVGSVNLLALRYRFGKTFIGYEQTAGSKDVFAFDYVGETATWYYGTPGTTQHIYLLHKFNPNFAGRIGSRTQNYAYSGVWYGRESLPSDLKITNLYANLILDF